MFSGSNASDSLVWQNEKRLPHESYLKLSSCHLFCFLVCFCWQLSCCWVFVLFFSARFLYKLYLGAVKAGRKKRYLGISIYLCWPPMPAKAISAISTKTPNLTLCHQCKHLGFQKGFEILLKTLREHQGFPRGSEVYWRTFEFVGIPQDSKKTCFIGFSGILWNSLFRLSLGEVPPVDLGVKITHPFADLKSARPQFSSEIFCGMAVWDAIFRQQ